MVAVMGFEPIALDYETNELPLLYTASILGWLSKWQLTFTSSGKMTSTIPNSRALFAYLRLYHILSHLSIPHFLGIL